MTNETDDNLTKVRLDVAEMKGMLGAYVTANEIRIAALEKTASTHEMRLDDKAKRLTSEKERNDAQDRAILSLQQNNEARYGKILGAAGLVVAVLTATLAIFNSIRI